MASPISFTGALFNPNQTITEIIKSATEETSEFALIIIKSRTPVRTGLLRSQWESYPVAGGVKLDNPTPYAGYVEVGTRFFAGTHMLESSLPDIEQNFRENLNNKLGEKLAGKIATERSGQVNYDNLLSNSRIIKSGTGFIIKK